MSRGRLVQASRGSLLGTMRSTETKGMNQDGKAARSSATSRRGRQFVDFTERHHLAGVLRASVDPLVAGQPPRALKQAGRVQGPTGGPWRRPRPRTRGHPVGPMSMTTHSSVPPSVVTTRSTWTASTSSIASARMHHLSAQADTARSGWRVPGRSGPSPDGFAWSLPIPGSLDAPPGSETPRTQPTPMRPSSISHSNPESHRMGCHAQMLLRRNRQ